jgi:peroxiredoxin
MMKDKPYTNRVTFVIDDKGVLRHVDTAVKVDSHGKDVVEVVKKLKG